jgi:hypothetical protein
MRMRTHSGCARRDQRFLFRPRKPDTNEHQSGVVDARAGDIDWRRGVLDSAVPLEHRSTMNRAVQP